MRVMLSVLTATCEARASSVSVRLSNSTVDGMPGEVQTTAYAKTRLQNHGVLGDGDHVRRRPGRCTLGPPFPAIRGHRRRRLDRLVCNRSRLSKGADAHRSARRTGDGYTAPDP